MRKHLPIIVLSLLVLLLSMSCKQGPATYTITYDKNGGEEVTGTIPEAQKKTAGTTLTLASNTGNLAKTDYTFAGWNTQADGKGTDYAVGSTYSTDADLTLYAKWIQYVKFSSSAPFTLVVHRGTMHWAGTLQYSTDATSWTTWDGTEISSSTGKVLYLRGSGNSVITGDDDACRWVLTPTGDATISCTGNIETLLDYATVVAGNHPTMGECCYAYLFTGCTSLTTAPALPAKTMAKRCYASMFQDCTTLETAPTLPAETLANYCYDYMFYGCIALTTVPALPAETLAENCYSNMFNGCSLIKMSATQTGEYQNAYRIPKTGTGTTATNWNKNIFKATGGPFTSDPTINTTYYTSNTVVTATP